jgi:uncharacterized protein (TIRG00374 family)
MSSQKLNFKKIINRMILFIALGVGAHIIFVLSTTEKSLLKYLNNLSIGHLCLIVILMLLPWACYALRVLMWSGFFKEKIRYADALRIVITADLASALSPTSVGGAPVKAALLLNRGFAAGSVGFLLTYGVIEDIVFYLTGILLAAIFSAGLLSDISTNVVDFIVRYSWQIILGILVISGYFYMLAKNKIPMGFRLWTYIPLRFKEKMYSFRSKLNSSYDGMKTNFKLAIQHGKLRMLASISMLFLQWGSKFSVLLVILHAFDVDFDAIQMYVRQWVVYVTMLFIPTPGASGGAEASFLLIFGKSIPPDLSYLIVSVWRLFTYYFVLLAAVIFYSILSFLLRKEEEIVIESNQ